MGGGEGGVIVVLTTMQSWGEGGLFKQVNLGQGRGEMR